MEPFDRGFGWGLLAGAVVVCACLALVEVLQ